MEVSKKISHPLQLSLRWPIIGGSAGQVDLEDILQDISNIATHSGSILQVSFSRPRTGIPTALVNCVDQGKSNIQRLSTEPCSGQDLTGVKICESGHQGGLTGIQDDKRCRTNEFWLDQDDLQSIKRYTARLGFPHRVPLTVIR